MESVLCTGSEVMLDRRTGVGGRRAGILLRMQWDFGGTERSRAGKIIAELINAELYGQIQQHEEQKELA